MVTLSLGGTKPRPKTCRGTMAKAAAEAAAPRRSPRREMSFVPLTLSVMDVRISLYLRGCGLRGRFDTTAIFS